MSKSNFKVISALPTVLVADSVYYVRVGTGVDIYVTNKTAPIIAKKHNTTVALAPTKIFDSIDETDNLTFTDAEQIITKGADPYAADSEYTHWIFELGATTGDHETNTGYFNRANDEVAHAKLVQDDTVSMMLNFTEANKGDGNIDMPDAKIVYFKRHASSTGVLNTDIGVTIPATDFKWHQALRISENNWEYAGTPFDTIDAKDLMLVISGAINLNQHLDPLELNNRVTFTAEADAVISWSSTSVRMTRAITSSSFSLPSPYNLKKGEQITFVKRSPTVYAYPSTNKADVEALLTSTLSAVPAPNPANNIGAVVPRGVIDSRSGGMLTNGGGLLGSAPSNHAGAVGKRSLYNFDAVNVTAANRTAPEEDGNLIDGVGMGFTVTGGHAFFGTDGTILNEIIAVNPHLAYRGSGSVAVNQESVDANQKLYVGHAFLDQNGSFITASEHQHRGFAKLAQDLTIGTDTWMYIYRDDAVDPHAEWIIGNAGADNALYGIRRGIAIWDHCFPDQQVDANGNSIPFTKVNATGNPDKPAGFGYSRHRVDNLWDNTAGLWEQANDGTGAGNWNGHTNVWRHPIKLTANSIGHSYSTTSTASVKAEGTPVSHNWHGGTYKYCYVVSKIMANPDKFLRYEGWIGGVDMSGLNKPFNFPPGTAGCTWMMLSNYAASTTAKVTHSALSMLPDTGVRLTEDQVGAIPEHTGFSLRKVEADGAVATVTNITAGRSTYGRRTIV